MTVSETDRIQYLTNRAQRGSISRSEQEELAHLLGRNPRDYQGEQGLALLIILALSAIAAGIIIALLSSRR